MRLAGALAAGLLLQACVVKHPAPVVHVFLLAGQSNMEGHAVVDLDDARDYNGGRGNLVSLLADPERGARWRTLRNPDGSWAVRDDVFVSYKTERGQKAGPLSVGFAVYDDQHHFGPELAIGQVLGDHFTEPVLLVKTAWGGKSLAVDFRPPSAGGEVGPYYRKMLEEFRAALAGVSSSFPQLAECEVRVEGVIWFQGWNDGCDPQASAAYEDNLVHLINDLRSDLGDPRLPFVVGETGNMDNMVLRDAQRAACARPEVGGGALRSRTPSRRKAPTRSLTPYFFRISLPATIKRNKRY